MIVCHCNVITDKQLLDTLADEPVSMPRSPVQAIRCLGCAPDCGRCVATIRKLLADARESTCVVGCPSCPGAREAAANDGDRVLARHESGDFLKSA